MLRRLLPGDRKVASGCWVPTRAVSTGGPGARPWWYWPQHPLWPRGGATCPTGHRGLTQPGPGTDWAWPASPQRPAHGQPSKLAGCGRGPGSWSTAPRSCPRAAGQAGAGSPRLRGARGWGQVKGVPVRPLALTRPLSASSAQGGGTPGQGCHSFCRRPRRSSSLLLERNRSQGRRSSTWPVPSTCSVSSGTEWEGQPCPGPFLCVATSAPLG